VLYCIIAAAVCADSTEQTDQCKVVSKDAILATLTLSKRYYRYFSFFRAALTHIWAAQNGWTSLCGADSCQHEESLFDEDLDPSTERGSFGVLLGIRSRWVQRWMQLQRCVCGGIEFLYQITLDTNCRQYFSIFQINCAAFGEEFKGVWTYNWLMFSCCTQSMRMRSVITSVASFVSVCLSWPLAVLKQLSQSRCRLGYGVLRWAQVGWD